MDDLSISIRNLQHYMYCPHRWGLINIDCSWAENVYVTKGNLLHKRVHDPGRAYLSRQKRVMTSVPVYHDELGLYGVTDCIELTQSSNGITVEGFKGPCQLTIVEYKPRAPKNKAFNEDDAIQVYAQKLCVDNIFHCNSEGVLYYADQKRRQPLPLEENSAIYQERLEAILKDIRRWTLEGKIPPIPPKQKCRGCSFNDVCLPKTKRREHFKAVLEKINTP